MEEKIEVKWEVCLSNKPTLTFNMWIINNISNKKYYIGKKIKEKNFDKYKNQANDLINFFVK